MLRKVLSSAILFATLFAPGAARAECTDPAPAVIYCEFEEGRCLWVVPPYGYEVFCAFKDGLGRDVVSSRGGVFLPVGYAAYGLEAGSDGEFTYAQPRAAATMDLVGAGVSVYGDVYGPERIGYLPFTFWIVDARAAGQCRRVDVQAPGAPPTVAEC